MLLSPRGAERADRAVAPPKPMPDLPTPPGQSPFHVRGSSYLRMRDYIDQKLPGGIEAVLARLEGAELRQFARQVFLPVSWYDALPLLPLSDAIAAVEGRPYADSVRHRAVLAAESDLSGLYRVLLKVVSPELAIERLQRTLMRYFDFGRIDGMVTTRGRSEGRLSGFPAPLVRWFAPMVTGYAPEVLRAAGAIGARAHVAAPQRVGARLGIETVTLTLHFSWS